MYLTSTRKFQAIIAWAKICLGKTTDTNVLKEHIT